MPSLSLPPPRGELFVFSLSLACAPKAMGVLQFAKQYDIVCINRDTEKWVSGKYINYVGKKKENYYGHSKLDWRTWGNKRRKSKQASTTAIKDSKNTKHAAFNSEIK
jgi:hypothetical protein